jgi:hypothetical protein
LTNTFSSVGLWPEALELARDGVPARVEMVEELGADARRAPARGERVALAVRPGEAHLFDAASGQRL